MKILINIHGEAVIPNSPKYWSMDSRLSVFYAVGLILFGSFIVPRLYNNNNDK